MNSTLFLQMFGLDPEQYEDAVVGPTETEAGWALSVVRKSDPRKCPHCKKGDAVVIKDRRVRKLRHAMPDGKPGLILIEHSKFRCNRCNKYFYPDIAGVKADARMTAMEERSVTADFATMMTFSEIARRHGISRQEALKIFDKRYPFVPGRPLPRILCIDEVMFVDRVEGKYPAILYDWERREIVDVVRSRQKAWLEDWFSRKPKHELETVRYLVSDMYDEYARVKRRFLPNAKHVIDLFHVV